ncbi:Fic family protein [Alicyclobacillus fodiniaquatilis]|uniref:Fic family protein n=1 Tax=Alicyclobacillus fodiniaquatilis TaxID=1661150 RepID=A0ABW4JIX0_9BACL
MYQPRFTYTNDIVKDLMLIEKSKVMVDILPIPVDVARSLRKEAHLKMTHYSTRIEGNPLSLEQVSEIVQSRHEAARIRAEEEVRNYWDALTFLDTARKLRVPITESFIQRLHAIIERSGAGRRVKQSTYRGPTPPGVLFAVYDTQSRQPDYIPPEWTDVPELMKNFVEWVQVEQSLPVPIKAAIAAYQLLTIHPFEDGNGRTSRALATYILSTGGYNLRGFNSMEEYYVSDLEGYYRNIQMGLPVLYYDGRNHPPDLAPWIGYFTRIMGYAFERVASRAKQNSQPVVHPLVSKLEPNEIVLLRALLDRDGFIKPKEIADLFHVSPRTATNWAKRWLEKGLLSPAGGERRITLYAVGSEYAGLSQSDLGYIMKD